MSHIKLFAATGLLLGLAITQVYGQTNAPRMRQAERPPPRQIMRRAQQAFKETRRPTRAAPQANLPFNNPNALVGNPPHFRAGSRPAICRVPWLIRP